jgi:S1-C subfamily serine protease
MFPPDDLAVIRLKDAKPAPATFADSSKLEVGDIALAIGNPLGLRSSVTQGIISSLGRTVNEGNGVVLPSVIQTSADINPGNSGGALVDISGQVIGIPTLAALDPQLGGAQAPGIGFAIPSNTVKQIADQLIKTGHVQRSGRAELGVRISSIVGGGVLVSSVVSGSPAAKAGIKAGDIILALNDQPTPTTGVLVSVLAQLKPGQTVPVKVLHPDGKKQTVNVTLGQLSG